MTNVSPSNLKLIGRATFLIQSHVNDALGRPDWIRLQGRRKPITYGEANAVLFDEIAFVKGHPEMAGQTAEVALSIIRILESFRQKARALRRRRHGPPPENHPFRLPFQVGVRSLTNSRKPP